MKNLVFVVIFLSASPAMSEIVTCKTTNKSKIKSIRLVRAEHDYQPQWIEGEVDLGILSKNERVVVADAPRNQNLNYVDNEYNDTFWLELGPYHGQGAYPKAKLSYTYKRRYSEPEQLTAEMSCTLSGSINFKNYCDNPEQNLLSAIRDQKIGIVLSTLACGVDVNIKDERGCSPVLLAADRDCGTGKFDIFSGGAYSDKIILSLLDNGAMAEDLDPATLETPLHKLIRQQDVKAASSLIQLEVDFNAQDKEGSTPLMRAVETSSYLVVDAITSAGADLNLKNKLGQTAKDIAVSKKFTHLLPYLVEAENLEVVGTDDGKCAPMEFHVETGKAVKVTLRSDSNKMFMLTSEKLELSMMVNGHSSQSQRFAKLEPGEYPMSCGLHGGQQYSGKITVANQ